MRLKNKKTGEIVSLEGELLFDNEIMLLKQYSSLAELNEEWEDYEEPKGIQCIYYVNHFDAAKIDGVIIGFGTKEEAEKAVEKLKAWKRLKDKGFRFYDWKDEPTYRVTFEWEENIKVQEIQDDLDLLFCPEENS